MPRLSGLGFRDGWLFAQNAIDFIATYVLSTWAGGSFCLRKLCQVPSLMEPAPAGQATRLEKVFCCLGATALDALPK